MSGQERSKHQQKIISRYYDNLDTIMLQRLSELVTELYLAESDKKKQQLWQRVEKAMTNLKIPPAIRRHIMEKQDVEILAKNLQDWQKRSGKK